MGYFPPLDDSQKMVLRLIRKHHVLSGAELARKTSLQPSTMVYLLRKLHKAGLISQAGTGTSTGRGGKKPTLWKIAKSRFHLLGIEILPTKTRYVICDINGDIGKKKDEKLSANGNRDGLAERISNVFEKVLPEYTVGKTLLIGAGIGLPGLVDSVTSTVLYSSSLKTSNYPVLEKISGAVDFPVFVANDANTAALTVHWYPSENGDYSGGNFVYLLYTQGATNLGSGLFINGELFQGYFGTAGEIFTPLPRLKDWINGGIEKGLSAKDKSLTTKENVDVSEIIQHAKTDCPLCDFVISQLMTFIGDEIIRIVGFINPEEVILGGDLVDSGWLLEKYLLPYLSEKSRKLQPLGYQLPGINYSTHGKYSVSLGATALVLNELL